MNVIALSPVDLTVSALLILVLAGLSRRLRLGVERQLLFSAARSTIQLLLIGLVLKVLFDRSADSSAGGDSAWEPCRCSSLHSRSP